MDDFYKQIKDSLNSLPEPSFRKRDWKALLAEMRSVKLSPLAFWGWLATPCLITLGLLAYWQYGIPAPQAGNVVVQADTVYITRTIRQLDTVYLENTGNTQIQLELRQGSETARMRQLQEEISILKNQLASLMPETHPPGKVHRLTTAPGGNDNTGELAGKHSKGEAGSGARLSDDAGGTAPGDGLAAGPAEVVKTRGYAPLESPLLADLPSRRVGSSVIRKYSGKRDFPLAGLLEELGEIRFNPLQLGAGTGLFYPSFGKGDYRIGKMAGIQVLMPLTKHLQAESNLTYQNVAYETEDLAETGGTLPVAPEDNLRFLKVEAPFKSVQWDLGVNYAFNNGGKFQPKLGVGYGLIYYYQNELNYEFENEDNGITWSIEEGGNQNGFHAVSWLLKTGGDLQVNSDWVLTVSGMYRIVNGTESYLVPSYWSYGLGLRYKF